MTMTKIRNIADLQAEKIKLKQEYKVLEVEINGKLNYLQNNFGAILIQTLSFKKGDENEQMQSFEGNSIIGNLIESFTGIKLNSANSKVLLKLAYTALPTILLSLAKNYIKKKFSK